MKHGSRSECGCRPKYKELWNSGKQHPGTGGSDGLGNVRWRLYISRKLGDRIEATDTDQALATEFALVRHNQRASTARDNRAGKF